MTRQPHCLTPPAATSRWVPMFEQVLGLHPIVVRYVGIDRLDVDGYRRQSEVLVPGRSRPAFLKPFLRLLDERVVSDREATGAHDFEDRGVVFQHACVRVGPIAATCCCHRRSVLFQHIVADEILGVLLGDVPRVAAPTIRFEPLDTFRLAQASTRDDLDRVENEARLS